MSEKKSIVLITAAEMQSVFERILRQYGFTNVKSERCAGIFTASSVDGVYSHGVNRFATFVNYVKKGYVKPDAEPSFKSRAGAIEQWDGNLGPGPLNASFATDRAIELAAGSGIGCIALSNTNHWMRGGTYGWQAAKKGFAFIGFTNTIANMPVWGAKDSRLGNNPFIIALPFKDEAIVLDMAMSQFSFGALHQAKMRGEMLTVDGGYDRIGQVTNDPAKIIESGRPLPVGYWKGAGMALLLDMLATILAGGMATYEITRRESEYGLSQVFIAINISGLASGQGIASILEGIIADYHGSERVDETTAITYPGERTLATRKRNLENGIPVVKGIWEDILRL